MIQRKAKNALRLVPMDGTEPSDDDLLAAAARGEERAFAVLVRRHADRLRALAYRLTGDGADADDLVQEAFCRAFEQAPRWRREGIKFSTWAYRVIMNLAADRARRLKVRKPVALEDISEPVDAQPDAQAYLHDKGRRAAVNAAIAALPDRQRQAVVLTYGEGLSNAETADAMGVSVEAVEAALTRARTSLRDSLREQGWMEEEDGDGQDRRSTRSPR